jgi:hypothetical protein
MRGLTIGDRVFDADGRLIKPHAIIEAAVSVAKWGEP